VGKYVDKAADVTSIEADTLTEDPAAYFGTATHELIIQAFVRVDSGMVWLDNGQKFRAGAGLQGNGSAYRNAIVWLKRGPDGLFAATALRYTNYRAQPRYQPPRTVGHGAGDLILPPDAPPDPPGDAPPTDGTDDDTAPQASAPAPADDGAGGTVQDPLPSEAPISNAAPTVAEPSVNRAFSDVRWSGSRSAEAGTERITSRN
jgi:hypothetical protein